MAKILIVDDEPDVCRVLKKFLISQEHDVQVALNAKEALKSQAAFRPHLILLDIMMPGMTGIDALHHIKSEDPEVRVLMVSAVGMNTWPGAPFRTGPTITSQSRGTWNTYRPASL